MKQDDQGLLSGCEFIVFGEDFGRHAHSLEHLLRPLFSRNQFIWVETIGLRAPKLSLYDFKRIFEKIGKWVRPQGLQKQVVEVPDHVTIVRPLMLPFNKVGWVRAWNRWSVHRAVQKAIVLKGFTKPVSIASVPNAADYVGSWAEVLKIYACVDEFSLWPGLDYEMVREMENRLLKKVDLVFATSKALASSKSNQRSVTQLLTHGVDFSHFNIGSKELNTESLQICYFGLFDERTDQTILRQIAEANPQDEIHIIGNVVCDISSLKGFKNIIFQGPVAYQNLPQAIKKMDIFILPYVRSALTENINPLKLKEYLSTGRPVLATALPEVRSLKEHLVLCDKGEDFVREITKLRSSDSASSRIETLQYLEKFETWEAKARLLSSVVVNSSVR